MAQTTRPFGVEGTGWLSPIRVLGRHITSLASRPAASLPDLLRVKRTIFLEYGAKEDSDIESSADKFAATLLIPEDRTTQLKSIATIDEAAMFADRLGIHPGIVVGRLQHEGHWDHSRGNELRQRQALRAG